MSYDSSHVTINSLKTDNINEKTDGSGVTIDASNIIVKGNIIPDISNTYDLGSVDKPFRDMYISENTIYIGETLLTIDENDKTFKVKRFRNDWNTRSISSTVNDLLNNNDY